MKLESQIAPPAVRGARRLDLFISRRPALYKEKK